MNGLEERATMANSLSGGTAHLLRTTRSGCQSALSFVAFSDEGGELTVATYPEGVEEGPLDLEAVVDIVRQLWLDPGIARRKVLLRTVRVTTGVPDEPTRAFSVAVVPLGADGAGGPTGLLGVVDPASKTFGVTGPGVLYPMARRVSAYLSARAKLRDLVAAAPTIELPPLAATAPAATAPLEEVPAAEASAEPEPGGSLEAERLLVEQGSFHGLLSLGALLARIGRLLGAAGEASGALAVVVLEVKGAAADDREVSSAAARALRAVLRFDDPVSRVGSTEFLVAVPLTPGGSGAETTVTQLTASVRAAVAGTGAVVRSAYVVADLATSADVEELVRAALGKLRAE